MSDEQKDNVVAFVQDHGPADAITKDNVVQFIHCKNCIQADRRDDLEIGFVDNATIYVGCKACGLKICVIESVGVK